MGPTPKISVSVVFDAVTAAAMRFLVSLHLLVDAPQVLEEVEGELVASGRDGSFGLELFEQFGCS